MPEALLAAVARALAGNDTIFDTQSELRDLRRRHATLSSREREVMGRVVAGLLNKQVASSLGISEVTVKAHRGQVMRKMGADSLAELVTMVMLLSLVPAQTSRREMFQ